MARGRTRITREQQIERMTEAHQGYYSYEQWGWPKTKGSSVIVCPLHGPFTQKYNNHAGGQGCQTCGDYYRKGLTPPELPQLGDPEEQD